LACREGKKREGEKERKEKKEGENEVRWKERIKMKEEMKNGGKEKVITGNIMKVERN
jgi:hypothetical protein